MNAAKLNEAMDYIQANSGGPGAAESVVVRHGYLIWKGSQADTQHSSWSCSKSFASTVLGLLIEDDRCTLDTRAANFLPKIADRYPAYADITLRHFATMTSGYDGVGGGYADKNMDGSSTWSDPAPPLFAPGSAFSYWDDAQSQFGHVLTLAAGEELGRYFKRRIADPIGMTNWHWGTHASADGRGIYGFNCWVNGIKPDGKRPWPSAPPRTFLARGFNNNVCFVVLEWDLVLVRIGTASEPGTRFDAFWDTVFTKLAPGIDSRR